MTNISISRLQGTENLEVMAEAENYNAWLLAMTQDALADARSVLDFGAGMGQFAIPIAQAGRSVIAVEPDDRARAFLTGAGLDVHGSLSTVPDRSVDAIYTLNVLEHIPNDETILHEMWRCLKPGGTLFVYVPAFMVLFTAMDERVGHVRRYRKAPLIKRVQGAGFAVEASRYADCLGFFATLLYRMVGPKDGTINRDMLRTYDRFAFPISRLLDRPFGQLLGKNVWLKARRM
jgi:SAM-dependent methyltransferase